MVLEKTKHPYSRLAASLLVSILVIVVGLNLVDTLTGHLVLKKLLWPLARLMIFISIGLLAGQVIEASG